jgi:hypothetical protein
LHKDESMNNYLADLEKNMEAVRRELLDHPVYQSLETADDLRHFMEHHSYAVWDFMSLVKWLQHEFTCTTAPWVPRGAPAVRAMINEIVLGEESDTHPNGGHISHYELYLEAMEQAQADTTSIKTFVGLVQRGHSIQEALAKSGAPASAASFVEETFRFIDSGKPHVVASAFTFGREDLIPDMFTAFVSRMNEEEQGRFSTFAYYLRRHIEMDGDHHSHLAKQMIQDLCGTDENKWREATDAAVIALRARINLWAGVVQASQKRTTEMV